MNADGSGGTADRQPDLERLMSQRFAEYMQLWEGAAAKFSRSNYRSEDLIDDWFTFCGKAVRDATAGAALLWGAGTAPRPGPNPKKSPPSGSGEP